MACSHCSFCPGLSSDTPSTVKFLGLNFLKFATTFGFSWRQGPHQLAQKSSNTYLPRKEDSETGLPDVSACVKSIAILPTALIFAFRYRLLQVYAIHIFQGSRLQAVHSFFGKKNILVQLDGCRN